MNLVWIYWWIFLSIIFSSAHVSAATFTPASVLDLIGAINTANSNNEDDIIDLALGPFVLTAAYSGFDGLPPISSDQNHSLFFRNGTIERDSSSADLFRIIHVEVDALVSLSSVTIRGGNVPNPEDGGGILVEGSLDKVSDSTFTANKAAFGGAIAFAVGARGALISNCTFTTNINSVQGGALAVLGTLDSLINSEFSFNQANSGGAIYVNFGGELAQIANTTFNDNTASGTGGAVINGGHIGSIENAYFGRNAAVSGGALRITELSLGAGPGLVDRIDNCSFVGNRASSGGSGGAIEASNNLTATVRLPAIGVIKASRFLSNLSLEGGALALIGVIVNTIDTSTFDRNLATVSGGAVFCGSCSILEIKNSTFSRNEATGALSIDGGGAIKLDSENQISVNVPATIGSIFNSTFSRNKSLMNGGAFALITQGGPGSVNIGLLSNATIVNNEAGDKGGGLYFPFPNSLSEIISTIVARNVALTQGLDVYAIPEAILKESYNLIGINNGSEFIAGRPNANLSYVGTAEDPIDPELLPLANYGGLTETHALLPDSIAIDHGANPLNLEFDQRGFDFVRTSAHETDIGAFELQHVKERQEHHEDEGFSSPGSGFLAAPPPPVPAVLPPGPGSDQPPIIAPVLASPLSALPNVTAPNSCATASSLSAQGEEGADPAGGCSSIGGIGQGITNLILIFFTAFRGLRMMRSKKKRAY